MQCPADGTTLVALKHHGVPTDYCPQCRGTWLAPGDLQRIIERAVDEIEALPRPSKNHRRVAGFITTADIRR